MVADTCERRIRNRHPHPPGMRPCGKPGREAFEGRMYCAPHLRVAKDEARERDEEEARKHARNERNNANRAARQRVHTLTATPYQGWGGAGSIDMNNDWRSIHVVVQNWWDEIATLRTALATLGFLPIGIPDACPDCRMFRAHRADCPTYLKEASNGDTP